MSMDPHLFNTLINSVKEIDAIKQGKIQAAQIHSYKYPDIKKIRTQTNTTQEQFAKAVGASLSLVQNWEMRRRYPDGCALKLLKIIEIQPSLIKTLMQL